MKEYIFKDPERCSRVIEGYKKSEIEKYDLNLDIDYFVEKLIKAMKRAGIHFDVENAKRKDSFEAAIDVLNIFKEWIEYNKGWDNIQSADSKKEKKFFRDLFI